MSIIQIIESIITGIVAGFICGLTGMGGGTIYVPVFYFLLSFSIKEAIGTSLLVIVFSSISAFLAHMREGQVNFRIAGFLIVAGIIGAQIGSSITSILPDIAVKIFFICITIFLSINMWRERNTGVEGNGTNFTMSTIRFILIGLAAGIASGMGGVGGAIVLVPLLHMWVGIPMNICIGTTLPVVMFNSLSGVIGYFYRGLVHIQIGIITGVVAVFAALTGTKVSMRTDNKRLRKIFSIVLLIAGMAILVGR